MSDHGPYSDFLIRLKKAHGRPRLGVAMRRVFRGGKRLKRDAMFAKQKQ